MVNTGGKRGAPAGGLIDFLSLEHPWDVFQSGSVLFLSGESSFGCAPLLWCVWCRGHSIVESVCVCVYGGGQEDLL